MYQVERDSLVYAGGWGASLFRVSMVFPDGRVAISGHPATEPGVNGEVRASQVWPALPEWHGRRMLSGEVMMASPSRPNPDMLSLVPDLIVILAKAGNEYVTGLMKARDLNGDVVEWDAGHRVADFVTAVAQLRARSGWTA